MFAKAWKDDIALYISTRDELSEFISMISKSAVLAIDTEFHREKSYYARLCLLQLATDELSAIVDPLAGIDLTLLAPVLEDDRVVKVFHAGSQDIELLVHSVGVVPKNIFDTQLAAAMLGYPQQMGLGALVKEFCDVQLDKSSSYTDWTRRPLTPSQIEYAIDDVLYLPGIYRKMSAQLKNMGRRQWIDYEFKQMEDISNYVTDADSCWQKVKRLSGLSRRQLAVVRAVARWRELAAQERNVPRKWILTDDLVVEVAKRTPTSKSRLLEVRGIRDRLTERSIQDLLRAIRAELALPLDQWPKYIHKPTLAPGDECLADMLFSIVRLRARENSISAAMIASHEDMNSVVRGDKEVAVLTGWRYELAGRDLIDFLEGRTALIGEGGRPGIASREKRTEGAECDRTGEEGLGQS